MITTQTKGVTQWPNARSAMILARSKPGTTTFRVIVRLAHTLCSITPVWMARLLELKCVGISSTARLNRSSPTVESPSRHQVFLKVPNRALPSGTRVPRLHQRTLFIFIDLTFKADSKDLHYFGKYFIIPSISKGPKGLLKKLKISNNYDQPNPIP
jgi:hypothetical protein